MVGGPALDWTIDHPTIDHARAGKAGPAVGPAGVAATDFIKKPAFKTFNR
jgi:hypothetical protein